MMENPYLKNPHLPGDSFYWEAGPTGVLLIHGFTATTAEVRPLAKRLHAKGYTVCGPLLPGHGTSPADANRYTWRDWLAVIESAYQEVLSQCDQVYIGGESAGGLLALYMGSQHPEIKGILTYASALELTLTWKDKLKLTLASPFVPSISKGLTEDGLPWQGYWETPLRALIQLLRLQRQVKRRLPTIRRPLLVVQGQLDERIPPQVPEIIANAVRSAVTEIHWMENSSHVVILDSELDQVAALTLDFLEKTTL